VFRKDEQMAVGGPIYFFQEDELEYERRPRKSLALIEALEEEGTQSKEETAKVADVVDEARTRPGTVAGVDEKDAKISLYNHNLISKIEEDAKFFVNDSSISTMPSLHKFLPLLKQAILTFDRIDSAPAAKMTVHQRYQILKSQSGELLDDLTRVLDDLFKENHVILHDLLPEDAREVFTSNYHNLVADTQVEYREWQRGSPPQHSNTTGGKLPSQVSELTQSFDGSRSGKSR